jgi:23S rRNA (uridine2552-2'-O)-methyltransferase
MAFVRKDFYHKQAKDKGYRSRAVYKLKELHKRFRLFKQNGRVLDLGAAPGGWVQVALEEVGKRGRIVGVDLLPIDPFPNKPNITLLLGDILDEDVQEEALSILGGKAHTVLSDMAPNISGIRLQDCARSFDLAMMALEVARRCLHPGGAFVVKIFPGDDMELYLKEMKLSFKKVKTTRPDATRKSSSEVYVIGTGFKPSSKPKTTEDAEDKSWSPI